MVNFEELNLNPPSPIHSPPLHIPPKASVVHVISLHLPGQKTSPAELRRSIFQPNLRKAGKIGIFG